jgi:AraC family transcriptional regulator
MTFRFTSIGNRSSFGKADSASQGSLVAVKQSRILLVGACTTATVTLSNAPLVSDDVIVEQHQYPAGEIQDAYYDQHVLAISAGPPVPFETRVDGRVERKRVSCGDICFYPRGLFFRKRWVRSVELLHVAFSCSFVSSVALQTIGSAAVQWRDFRGVRDPQIRHLALALKTELQNGSPSGLLYQESVGLALCVHLLRQVGSVDRLSRREVGSMARPALRRTIEFIQSNLSSELTLASMAQVACLSPYHFSRAFRKSTGLSPHQYVLRTRVETAKHLLRASDLSLSEIAFRVGFFDQSHLARHFKRHYGVSPRTFRCSE